MLEILNGRDKFYQWDLGQKLIVDDSIIAVHYDNGTGDALVCGVYEYEGQRVADVPNIMLQSVWAIKCYAYCGECVRAEKVYEVEKRSRPDDYIYTETETIRYTTLLDMITATNDDLATVEQSLEASIEALAAEHTADMETVETQLAATNKDVATNTAAIAKHKEQLTQHATKLAGLSSNLDIQVNNIYKSLNEDAAKLTNHESRITTLENNPTGGGTAADVDWSENNPDSPAYIKNRTHYEIADWVEFLAECSPDNIVEDDGMMLGMFANPIGLEAGKQYKVNWNGVEYECVAADSADVLGDSGFTLLGDYSVMSGGESTGEPFLITDVSPELVADMGAGAMMMLLDGSTTLTLKIDVLGGIKKLDNKYLDLSNYYTKEETDTALTNINSNFENYYTKTDIDAETDKTYQQIIYKQLDGLTDTGEIATEGYKEIYFYIYISDKSTEAGEYNIKAGSHFAQMITDGIAAGEIRVLNGRCYCSNNTLAITEITGPIKYGGLAPVRMDYNRRTSGKAEDRLTLFQLTTRDGIAFPTGSTLSLWGVKA